MEFMILLASMIFLIVQSFILGFIGRWREKVENQKAIDEAVQLGYDMYEDRHIQRRYYREDRFPR